LVETLMARIEPLPQAPAAPGPATWVRYQVLGALCLLGLLAYVHRVGFSSAGTYLKTDLGLSTAEWGYVMSAFLVGYALLEVPWGLLGDWLGARHLLTIMALAWSALTAAIPLVVFLPGSAAPWLPLFLLLLLRFLFGAVQAGIYPAISRVLTDWMPTQERATATGGVWMCSRLGGFLAPLLMVGLIADLGLSWEDAMILTAGLGLIWSAAFWPWFRNRPEEMRGVNAAELGRITSGRAASAAGHVRFFRLLVSRSVWALCFMYGFGGFSASFFITLLPNYLRDQRGLSADQMKWLQALPLGCGVVACLLGGVISDWMIRGTGNRKWGRRLSGMVGHALAGVAILATIGAHDVPTLAVLLSLTFFFNDLAMGPAWAACADIGERYAGTLGGAMNMIGNLFAALGAVVAGSLFDQEFVVRLPDLAGGWADHVLVGNELVFVVFAGSFWLAALCWLGVDVTRPLTGVIDEKPKSPEDEEDDDYQR
jgi:sugar phosphate permease